MALLENKLNNVFQAMHTFLNERKIISRLELRLKIKELIVSHKFTTEESTECEIRFEYPLEQFIFLSLTSGTPSSIQAPLLHEKLVHKEMVFYCSHTFTITDEILEHAYEAASQLQLIRLKQILTRCFLQVQYKVNEISSDYLKAIRNPFELNCHLFSSILKLIGMIKSLDLNQTAVLIIPPGATIKPFVEFYQGYSNRILLEGANVWLIDPETEALSTFIGVPKDNHLFALFTKSQLATQIERFWRPTITEDF